MIDQSALHGVSAGVCGCARHDAFSRRRMILGGVAGAAVALSSGLPSVLRAAETAGTSGGAIDVHHHIYPPIFAKMWAESPEYSSASKDPVLPRTEHWSPQWMIEELDKAGVEVAVMSNNDRSFVAKLPVDKRRQLARSVNEYAATLRQQYKGRLGLFAYLPFPDVEGSLKEIEYALDSLGAEGIHMMTSYADATAVVGERWLGDAKFIPILEELNRRKATVFCHPRAPNCCRGLPPDVPPLTVTFWEYPYDTGRTIMDLLISGSLHRYSNINWIFCHTGAVIPTLAERLGAVDRVMGERGKEIAPQGAVHELQRLNWDTAGRTSATAMHALLEFTTIDHVLFGSDSPFVLPSENLGFLDEIRLTPAQMRAIKRENALRLLPPLRRALSSAAGHSALAQSASRL